MVFPRPLPSLQNYITWLMLGKSALPKGGGILDQMPDVLEDFRILSEVQAQEENKGKK